VAYETHKRHYANDSSASILVVDAPTRTLNPTFDAATIAIAEGEDPESAASEYGQAWRVAGGTLVRPAVYDACVDKGVTEREPTEPLGDDYYNAAVDLSGGTGDDSAALSIQHVEEDEQQGPAPSSELCVQDYLAEWTPPFDPGTMVQEVALACHRRGE
jgi:hypothetical protein